jgi:integrase
MPLSDALARAAKPKAGKLTKFSDGYGLQLWAHPNGVRSWHVAYRFEGRQRSVTLGDYPELSLKEARERTRDIRRRVAAGEDPSPRASVQATARAPAAATFGAIKADWLAKVEREGKAEATRQKAVWLTGLLGSLDSRPIAEIKSPEILDILKPIEAAGHLETVRRLRSTASRIFRYAAALGAVEHDPAALLLGAVAAPKPVHRAAILEPRAFGALLRAIDAYEGRASQVREALQLLALTAARPGDLRLAQWEGEFDLDVGVWTVPASRMKMREPHKAPLARQAVEILRRLQKEDGLARPASPFLFPSPRPGRPLSENAFNVALRAMGFGKEDISAHGFRSTFSTMANESGLFAFDAIERALAHQDGSEVRRAYHRADYFEERKRLMQWWADKVDAMRADSRLGSVDAQPSATESVE